MPAEQEAKKRSPFLMLQPSASDKNFLVGSSRANIDQAHVTLKRSPIKNNLKRKCQDDYQKCSRVKSSTDSQKENDILDNRSQNEELLEKSADENSLKSARFADVSCEKHAEKTSSPNTAVDTSLLMITSKEPSLEYWKELAEQRRNALEDALAENERLHTEVEVLEKHCADLKELLARAEEILVMVQDGEQ